MPKTCLIDWCQCVAYFYPTTPTDYPSTARGMCVGPPVAVKSVEIWFFDGKFSLNHIGTVCHWKPFWSRAKVYFIGQCWYFNPQWTPLQAIIKTSSVRTLLVSWEMWAFTVCLHIYWCLCRVFGDGGVHSGSWKKAWTSRVLRHSKPQ